MRGRILVSLESRALLAACSPSIAPTVSTCLSPSVYLKKKLSRVVSLLDTAPDMADIPSGGIEALLQSSLEDETVRAFEPHSKKAKRSPEECQSSDAVDADEFVAATFCYYEKLLEAPPELPKSTGELQSFLSARIEKLPLVEELYSAMHHPSLVQLCTSAAEKPLASFLVAAYSLMRGSLENEATSCHKLCFLSGDFFEHLN